MSEIQVWERVLKWGHAQNPGLPSDITNYSKDDFNALKILPYREILSEELFINLLKTFLSLSDLNIKPSDNSKPCITKKVNLKAIDSNIITSQHVEMISKWIDRLEITDELLTSSYEYKLLFPGSRDGLTRHKFHEIYDGIPRTVTIVKVKDNTSFIFSFNNDVIEDYILSRVMNGSKVTYVGDNCGPIFGDGDLTILRSRKIRN
ncbi:hypothetical protein C1646_812364 [Rhizophagus diaphanus]|nr:hypothetical protein C1646_812364 [Rhizophagus diaphanus] [Rhizophagus sp. MUCL 43196]